MLSCAICGGGPLALLGSLGKLTWFRCTSCGQEQALTRDQLKDYEVSDGEEDENYG